jgi:hypothetical protein
LTAPFADKRTFAAEIIEVRELLISGSRTKEGLKLTFDISMNLILVVKIFET